MLVYTMRTMQCLLYGNALFVFKIGVFENKSILWECSMYTMQFDIYICHLINCRATDCGLKTEKKKKKKKKNPCPYSLILKMFLVCFFFNFYSPLFLCWFVLLFLFCLHFKSLILTFLSNTYIQFLVYFYCDK